MFQRHTYNHAIVESQDPYDAVVQRKNRPMKNSLRWWQLVAISIAGISVLPLASVSAKSAPPNPLWA